MIPEPKQVSVDKPWLLPAAIEWLEGILLKHWTVLETGAGGSTVFFAARVNSLITYEHDAEWASSVTDRLAHLAMLNQLVPGVLVDMRFRPTYPTAGLMGLPTLDLAFIDGRGRVRSVLDALPALRPGGWMVLDDAGRDRYSEARRVMDNACSERIEFRSPPWQPEQWTTAWRKR